MKAQWEMTASQLLPASSPPVELWVIVLLKTNSILFTSRGDDVWDLASFDNGPLWSLARQALIP